MSGFKWSTCILERCKCRCSPRIDSGLLLFLVYINDFPNGLKSNPKLFADDAFLFSVILDVNLSQMDLIEDLDQIINWAY